MAQKQKIYIPTFISSIDYKPARVLPHVYFWNGLRETDTFYIQSYASGSTNALSFTSSSLFPYFDNYNVVGTNTFPSTGSLSLLFNNEISVYGDTPNNSLYSDYWSSYVNLLYNPRTRLIDCTAIIPLADYFKMELNDIVEWRGNYYHLRAINDYNLSNGECSLQLLGPIIADTISTIFGGGCNFGFSSEVYIPTTTTTTTTTLPITTTTLAPTTTTTSTTTTTTVATLAVEFNVVAGGGGGGSRHAGGGGGGGWLSTNQTLNVGTAYPVVVGAGGAGAGATSDNATHPGTNGGNSSFNTAVAVGGGGGGGTISSGNGLTGGSGGGASAGGTGGTAVAGQGYNGGNGIIGSAPSGYAGGGGGGAGQLGGNASNSAGINATGGKGGDGTEWVVSGFKAGGGGGSVLKGGTVNPGAGGAGGGGKGGAGNTGGNLPGAGQINTGGGGGAGSWIDNVNYAGAAGGSGIVIIRYAGIVQKATGGTVVVNSGYTYHYFYTSDTFTVTG